MIKQWISSLTVYRFVTLILLIVVLVSGAAWYISSSLGGDEVDTDVHHFKAESSIDLIGGARGGNEFFDPTKKNSHPGTTGKLATLLKSKCEFNPADLKVSCEAFRTSMQSKLYWFESYTDTKLSGEEEGIFEFSIDNLGSSEVTVILEECVSTACKHAETVVDLSSN